VAFWTYVLRCADGSFYIGHTDALEKRIGLHQSGELLGYTHTRRPVSLVWQQAFETREEALSAERRINGWSRAKKQALVDGDWKEIRRLAWGTRNPMPEDRS
jgi:predicted GIY-YIG superfamily endonuclease